MNEWLDGFEVIVASSGWQEEAKVNKFLAQTSMRAYNALRKLITNGMTDEAKLELFKQTLLKAFGATPEKAFALACGR